MSSADLTRKLDVEKFKTFIAAKNMTMAGVSRKLGFGSGYLSNITSRGTVPLYLCKALTNEFGVSEDFFILAEKEPVVEEKEEVTEVIAGVDFSEVLQKLDELIVAVNKLGNIQMQNMEYTKAVMDHCSNSSSELKKLNEKWNKPQAYKR